MTPYLEIGGDYRQVLPGVYLLELPLPFSLGLINVYLVRVGDKQADGWLLIDSGMNTESCFQALDRAREGLGVAWTDIRTLLLTHIHPDHMGLARQVVSLSGARLLLHQADARLLDRVLNLDEHRVWNQRVLETSGVSPEMIARIQSSVDEIERSFYRLDADQLLSGGETIPTSGGDLHVVWTPGHSPGHVCLHYPAQRALFSGDHILEHISPNIGWHADHDALGEYLASLDRVAALDIDLILPSHGAPFTGHRDWAEKTRAHHAERCNRLLAALDGKSQTAAELIPALWHRPLSPFHYRFALYEALAHLDHMARTGRVQSAEESGITRWAKAPGV